MGNGEPQTFSFTAPAARRVQLAGDFTQWEQRALDMRKSADGTWRVEVNLPPGTHHYRFLVDGEWHDDSESASCAPNPYGGRDAVRQVAR